jgi:lipopolysaccharide export LptBFGC system permease protein LptF
MQLESGTFQPMPKHILISLRQLAALLVVCAGAIRVASLWFRELDEVAVLTLLTGTVYLILGIGLFGQSRFSLFMAVLLCSCTSGFALRHFTLAGMLPLQLAAVAADVLTAAICAVIFWQLRKEPSV